MSKEENSCGTSANGEEGEQIIDGGTTSLDQEEQEQQLYIGETTTTRCAHYKLSCAHEEMNPSRRSTMEDCHRVIPSLGGDPRISYFGVYDGHGGRQIVEFLETALGTRIILYMNNHRYSSQA